MSAYRAADQELYVEALRTAGIPELGKCDISDEWAKHPVGPGWVKLGSTRSSIRFPLNPSKATCALKAAGHRFTQLCIRLG